MIRIPGPSLGLNAENAPAFVNMDSNWTVPHETETQEIIDGVMYRASKLPRGKFRNIVISSHGTQAFVELGIGINYTDTGRFKFWRDKVEHIWIRSCSTGRIRPKFDSPPGRGNGHTFLSNIAREAHCYVIAPTEIQIREHLQGTLPPGMLDTYEGLVVVYGPNGNLVSSTRLPSAFEIGPNRYRGNPA